MFGSMAVLGAAFTSCSKGEDLFDSGAIVAMQKSEYATNFEKKYGPIDPNQTWDFATMEPITYLPSTSSAGTRSGEGDVTQVGEAGTMSIGNAVVTWMHANMEAGKNNSTKGSPFISVTDQRKFTIVPFYQGCASYFWELWMNVGGKDVKIWTKNQALRYKESSSSSEWKSPTNSGIPLSVTEIEAPTYIFEATPNQNMYFFLKVWTGGDDAYTRGDPSSRISSLDNMMLALEGVEGLTNIPEDSEVTVIGCEDNSKSASDKDFEDLVFIMYGPKVTHVDKVEVRETKRYMMEDLGTTDDFDFNDVVVDVANVYMKKITFVKNANGVEVVDKEEEIPGTRHQEAIVRAAGGIYDFTLTIGNTTWSKSDKLTADQMYNTGWGGSTIFRSGKESELAKFDVTGWVYDDNNISVTVVGKGPNDGVKTIKFPKKGEAPMMIAVPETQNWMTERSSVPSSWWYKVD